MSRTFFRAREFFVLDRGLLMGDPFFTTKAIGVGMGLCKAQRIIAEYHGKIHVESETGTGTKVSITIPMDR